MRFGLVANPFVCLGRRDHRESSRSRRIFPPASMAEGGTVSLLFLQLFA